MPQIAQQDYIKNAVYIADAENVTDDEKRRYGNMWNAGRFGTFLSSSVVGV